MINYRLFHTMTRQDSHHLNWAKREEEEEQGERGRGEHPLTDSLKCPLCLPWTASVKCVCVPLGSLHSSSSRSTIPDTFTSIRSGGRESRTMYINKENYCTEQATPLTSTSTEGFLEVHMLHYSSSGNPQVIIHKEPQ